MTRFLPLITSWVVSWFKSEQTFCLLCRFHLSVPRTARPEVGQVSFHSLVSISGSASLTSLTSFSLSRVGGPTKPRDTRPHHLLCNLSLRDPPHKFIVHSLASWWSSGHRDSDGEASRLILSAQRIILKLH